MGAGSGGPSPSNPLLQRGLPQGTLVVEEDPWRLGGGDNDDDDDLHDGQVQRQHQHEHQQGQGQGQRQALHQRQQRQQHQQHQQPQQQEVSRGELNLPRLDVPFRNLFSEARMSRIRQAFETGHYDLPNTIYRSQVERETSEAAAMLREHEMRLHHALLHAEDRKIEDGLSVLGMSSGYSFGSVARCRTLPPAQIILAAPVLPAVIVGSEIWEMKREADLCVRDLENGGGGGIDDGTLSRARQLCQKISAKNDQLMLSDFLKSAYQRLLRAVQFHERLLSLPTSPHYNACTPLYACHYHPTFTWRSRGTTEDLVGFVT